MEQVSQFREDSALLVSLILPSDTLAYYDRALVQTKRVL
jgi:hypothetical protein